MTQEQKDLLLKDLCGRLPYGVKCEIKNHNDAWKLLAIYLNGRTYAGRNVGYPIETHFENCKPYLFPISSITEEQWKEITDIQIQESLKSLDSIDDSMSNPLFSTDDLKTIEWCYANYIDIHNLIPMGLAIDATGLNIY